MNAWGQKAGTQRGRRGANSEGAESMQAWAAVFSYAEVQLEPPGKEWPVSRGPAQASCV